MTIDYKKFGDGKQPSEFPNTLSTHWWKLKGEELNDSISFTLKFLEQAQNQRITQVIVSTRLYGNQALNGLNGLTYSKLSSQQTTSRDRISWNVTQSVVDTITAKIAKNKPKPLFLTSGGNYQQQRKAKKLNKFVEGIFYENKAYELGQKIFRDSAIMGDGILHVFAKNDRVCYERVVPTEIWVDEIESLTQKPRQLHRVKNVDRLVLAEYFSDKRSLIMDASPSRTDDMGAKQTIGDLVQLRESWHLPSGPEANDGRHVISIPNAVLLNEKWEKDDFPFVFFKWCDRQFGFWAQGLVEQGQNIQLEINKLLWVVQRSLHLMGVPKIFIENSSKIVKDHLNNDIGAIITYSGTMPQYATPPAVQPEVYQHLQTLRSAYYELAGISQLSAASQKPSGLNSGKALREYNDIESDRFATISRNYENFFLALAKQSIDCMQEIASENGGHYEANVPGRKWLESIDWKDIQLGEDEYIMQCFPISSLPNDPAGRLQTVQEYMQAGLISQRVGKRLLDFPDLEAADAMSNSEEEYLTEILDKILDDGEYKGPEPMDDLKLARELALQYYALGKQQHVEPERLELIRRFLGQIDMLEQAAMPPPPQQALAPSQANQPLAPPVSPQASDLIPNTPAGLPTVQ